MASGFQLRAMDVVSAFRRTVTVRLKPDTTYEKTSERETSESAPDYGRLRIGMSALFPH
jgi:hypothetical protein